MDDLSFTTFLKIALMQSTQAKLGTLQRLLNSSRGYDFYKRMKLAAKEVAMGATEPEIILSKLEEIKNPAEKTHNINMAKNFLEWWQKNEGATALESRPFGLYKLPTMEFGIKCRPELSYYKNNKLHVTYLWATKTPLINRQVAALGLHILRSKLATGPHADAEFSILNLRTKTLLSDSLISNSTPTIALAEIASLERFSTVMNR